VKEFGDPALLFIGDSAESDKENSCEYGGKENWCVKGNGWSNYCVPGSNIDPSPTNKMK